MLEIKLDVKGLKCPLPILKAKKELAKLSSGDVLIVYTTDPSSSNDFSMFCKYTGHLLLANNKFEDNAYKIVIKHK